MDVDAISIEDLHSLIRDLWLTRYDDEIEAERAARRPGRPPSTKESKLQELKLKETEEYKTGMGMQSLRHLASFNLSPEVLDLTDAENVALFRRWQRNDAAYLDLLRYIRISSDKPDQFVVSRPGKHANLLPKPNPDAMDIV